MSVTFGLRRSELLQYFENAVVSNGHEEHVFQLDLCSLRWLLSRKIYFSSVSIADRDLREHLDALSSVVGRASHVECGLYWLCGDDVAHILQSCKQLRSLTVSKNEGMTDSALSAITEQHSQLKVLNIASCDELTSLSLHAIARNCATLEKLDIGSNGHLDGNVLAFTLCQLPNLHWLDVSGADFEAPDWEMIFEHCPLLEHIDISHTNFTPETLLYMGQRCPLIKCVVMDGKGTDEGIAALAQACPGLQKLFLRESNESISAGIAELARRCKDLRMLDLSDCSDVTNEDLVALAHGCPELRCLDCSLTGRTICDEGMMFLARGCPKLYKIWLPSSDAITDQSVCALALNCARLKTVHVRNGKNITNIGIIALATHCPRLQCLALTDSQITDAALVSLAAHQPGLWKLELRECSQVSSAGIVALAEGCHRLAYFKIDGCTKVGDAGAIAVVQNCRRLQKLELYDLPGLTNFFANVCISMNFRTEMFTTGISISQDKKKLLRALRS